MSRRAVIAMFIPAVMLATIVATLTGERRAISLQIWVACFIVVAAISTVNQLRTRAPLVQMPRRSVLQPVPDDEFVTASRTRRLRVLEGLVLRSRDSDRAFSQQLQPQLIRLATHHLKMSHGIDVEAQPGAAEQFLGEVGWLLDPTETGRCPTLEEIDQFVHALAAPIAPGDST